MLARGAFVFLTMGSACATRVVMYYFFILHRSLAFHLLAPAEEVEVSSLWVVKRFHQAVIPKLLARIGRRAAGIRHITPRFHRVKARGSFTY
uniref:Putative secreted protein n=1 Tax=Ixodes ricinus TaxID=34613 RepID=A0A6B0U4H3_IXORI